MSLFNKLYNNKFFESNKSLIIFIVFISIIITFFILKKMKIIEGFAPTDYNMGEFSGLLLKPEGCSDWRKPPACNKLLKGNVTTVFGSQEPLKDHLTKSTNEGPPVDGNSDDNRKQLFMFAYNKSSPDCCPSTYTTSTGCICTTKAQRDYINQRGNNRKNTEYPSYLDI